MLPLWPGRLAGRGWCLAHDPATHRDALLWDASKLAGESGSKLPHSKAPAALAKLSHRLPRWVRENGTGKQIPLSLLSARPEELRAHRGFQLCPEEDTDPGLTATFLFRKRPQNGIVCHTGSMASCGLRSKEFCDYEHSTRFKLLRCVFSQWLATRIPSGDVIALWR